jgi:hypothetical protein
LKNIHKSGLPMVSANLNEVRRANYTILQYDLLAMDPITIRRYISNVEYFNLDGTINYKQAMQDAAVELLGRN